MRRIRVFLSRFAGVFSRHLRAEQELADELESHLQMHIDDNLRSGMSSEQARRAALLQSGGVESAKQAYRDRETLPLLEGLLQDTRFAVRQMRKNPAFTGTAILILALGLCASVALFAFVDAALMKPLPYPNPTQLVHVTERTEQFPRSNLSYPDYRDWKRLNKVFSSMDVFTRTGDLLNTSAGAVPVPAARVSDGFFRTLGIVPALGRDFYAGEDVAGTPDTVILSDAAWKKRLGGTRNAIGQVIRLGGVPHTVIGVLPPSFQFGLGGNAETWTLLRGSGSCDLSRGCHYLEGIARLKNAISVPVAVANMTLIARQLETQYPASNRGQGATVSLLSEIIVGDVRPLFLMLLSGGILLLVIACVNVASLLLARSENRRREMAVRGSLGASSLRLITQFVTEASVLIAASTAIGLLWAHWLMKLLMSLIPADLLTNVPFLDGLGLNDHTLAFAGLVASIEILLFSIIPTLHLRFSDKREGLAEGTRGSAGRAWSRLGSNLVVLELAIAMVLLVAAGLLGKSLNRLLHVDLGFRPDHLITLSVSVPVSRYGKDEQMVALGRRIVARLEALPGVGSVGFTSALPVSFNGNTDWIRFVGRPYSGEHNEVNQRDVSAQYFKALQARLLRGRYFTDAEDASRPRVVVINKALADLYFKGEDPLGKRMGDDALSPKSLREIIGIVENIREGSLESEIWPAEYLPFNQSPDTYFSVIAQAEPSALLAASAAVHRIDSDLGTSGEATMTQRMSDSPSAYIHRSSAWLVGGFAGLALLLSVVGLYGVVAYSVSQRTREIGIRMALGAQRGNVHRLILREASRLTAGGLACGLMGSLAAAALMRKMLFGVSSWDVPTLVAVTVVLAFAALTASYIPARRAASVNPVEALRSE